MTDYVELHARSAFSFLDGATMPEFLIQQAAHLEMPAMGLLDRNGLYGAARFHMEGTRCGVQAHIGAEVSISDLGQCLQPAAYLPHHNFRPSLCVCRSWLNRVSAIKISLASSPNSNCAREKTKAERRGDLADVEEYGNGLVCLTGGGNEESAGCVVGPGRL